MTKDDVRVALQENYGNLSAEWIKRVQFLLVSLTEMEDKLTIKTLENAKGAQVLSQVEAQLHLEQKSVNELSLALQEAEEKVKKLEAEVQCKWSNEAYIRWVEAAKQAETSLAKLKEVVDKYRNGIQSIKELYRVRDEIDKDKN